MNNNNNQHAPQHNSQQQKDRHSTPENKDNLDSRKNLEISDNPSVNNEKEVKNGVKNERNETRGDDPNYSAP